MSADRISDLSIDELRTIIREELTRAGININPETHVDDLRYSDLSDFPVDSYGSWDDRLTLQREEIYGDDGR